MEKKRIDFYNNPNILRLGFIQYLQLIGGALLISSLIGLYGACIGYVERGRDNANDERPVSLIDFGNTMVDKRAITNTLIISGSNNVKVDVNNDLSNNQFTQTNNCDAVGVVTTCQYDASISQNKGNGTEDKNDKVFYVPTATTEIVPNNSQLASPEARYQSLNGSYFRDDQIAVITEVRNDGTALAKFQAGDYMNQILSGLICEDFHVCPNSKYDHIEVGNMIGCTPTVANPNTFNCDIIVKDLSLN